MKNIRKKFVSRNTNANPEGLNWINFIPLTLAGIINAFGVIMFLAPVNYTTAVFPALP